MEFRVLGPLEVRRDGSNVALGSFKQRSLLALLLIHANQVVSTDRIIDELWGEDDPATGRQNTLWVHMSHLRTALEPDREKRSEGTVLLTRAPGYELQVKAEELDAWKFEQLLAEGRGLLEADPGTASLVIGEALALWRGRPYADITYESFAQAEIGRLDELRLEAVELRLDADLRRGLASELVGELEALARQYPTRERFTEQLMLALYRSGRQADALRAFGRLRSRLGEELGIEPSAAARALEERMVVGDPSLDLDRTAAGAMARLAVRGYELRDHIGEGHLGPIYRAYQPSVGQEVSVEVVRSTLADSPGFIRRFDAEAEALAKLDHPSIVPLHDHWREPGAAYLVTAPVPGTSLAESVRHRPMPLEEAARLVADLAGALTQARRNGVQDRITVDNVAIDSKGSAHLRDFGLRFADANELTGLGSAGGESEDQSDLARLLEFAITGGSSLADAGIPDALVDVIERAASPGNGYRDLGSFASAVQSTVGLATPAETPGSGNPYKGLRAFEESDAADFFGRERVVERLLARLGEKGIRGRFVVLVGPSGSGKSSVVKAGLLAALRDGALPGSGEWFITTMTPGKHPFEGLESALLRVAVNPPPSLLEQLTDGESGIRRAVRRVLPDERSQLLLVIDQFEELFTQTQDATTQQFLEALAAAVDDPGGRLLVVATLRADFYDRPLRHRGIGELVRRGTEVITPLSPAEVERSITGPVESEGVGFEPGLVAQIVADVAEHPAALPLLQYALTELYERRRDRLIRLEDYVALGGMASVLARRAETLYADLDPLSQRAARQVLLRLVAVGDDADDVRRRVLRSELLAVGEGAGNVLDLFGQHRLLSFDRDPVTRGPTVEIAHEALIGEWGRLRRWIELSRDDLRMQRRLATGAAEWLAAGRNADYLLGGTRLDQLAEWSATTDLSLDGVERSFLEESLVQRDRELAAEETRSRTEQRLRLRTRSRTRLLVASGAVLAALAALAGFAFVQRNQADRLAGELEALGEIARLTSVSSLLAESDPELSALLALHSIDASAQAGIPATAETEEALHWALQAARVAYPVAEAPIEVRSGPHGLTGIYRLPLDELVAMAKGQLVNRALTAEECQRYGITPCPENSSTWPALAAEPTRPDVSSDGQPLAGTQVSLVGETPPEGLVDELTRFEEATGIEVSYERPPGPLEAQIQYTGATPIDLGIAPSMFVKDEASSGQLIDLSHYVERNEAEAAFGSYILEPATLGSGLYGLPMGSGVAGLVYYPLAPFTEAGYTAPQSWDELIALSRQMVADGRTPWCIGMDSPGVSGWPATNWVETLVLRTGGVDLYERWASGEVGFQHPEVRQAVAMFGEIVFGDSFVRGGPGAVNSTQIFDAVDQLGSDPPGCWLNLGGGWEPEQVQSQSGQDLGFFVFPPIDAEGPAPLIGSSSMVRSFRDRPEVRELVRSLLDPGWGTAWSAHGIWAAPHMPAHLGFDDDNCRSPDASEQVNTIRVEMCRVNHDAMRADQWRFDASDAMPPSVGIIRGNNRPGTFLQGMLDYIKRGPDSLDEVLAEIDASWPSG